MAQAATKLETAYQELIRQAAKGDVIHNDDSPMKILEFLKENQQWQETGDDKTQRTGIFTTGMVSRRNGRDVVLYSTGRRHAGENLAEVLKKRPEELDPPVQMCDALRRNLPGELKTIVANCLAHGRRKFVEVAKSFPDEVKHVLEELGEVYAIDARARSSELSPELRLQLHMQESKPVVDRLETWLKAQFSEKKVEENSGLGTAIQYMLKHWERLTLFLRVPGAPLDNNLCERMLKRAILHRKNSLFYKTENGARVGDLYMSLIASAKQAGVDPFHYLTELQRRQKEVTEHPSWWMPWKYKATLAKFYSDS